MQGSCVMWTPPVNESAELTKGALYLILYSETGSANPPLWSPLSAECWTNCPDLEEEELPVGVHPVQGLVSPVLGNRLCDIKDVVVRHRPCRTRPE